MHVRELPHIVMHRLVLSSERVNIRQFVRETYPSIDRRELLDFPDGEAEVGEAEGFALRLSESDSITTLSLHESKRAAIMNSTFDALGSLAAGRRYPGVWTASRGQKVEGAVWLTVSNHVFDGERLPHAIQCLAMLGRVASLGQEALRQGIELSSYFESEIRIGLD